MRGSTTAAGSGARGAARIAAAFGGTAERAAAAARMSA
jgi:hypothetical protein